MLQLRCPHWLRRPPQQQPRVGLDSSLSAIDHPTDPSNLSRIEAVRRMMSRHMADHTGVERVNQLHAALFKAVVRSFQHMLLDPGSRTQLWSRELARAFRTRRLFNPAWACTATFRTWPDLNHALALDKGGARRGRLANELQTSFKRPKAHFPRSCTKSAWRVTPQYCPGRTTGGVGVTQKAGAFSKLAENVLVTLLTLLFSLGRRSTPTAASRLICHALTPSFKLPLSQSSSVLRTACLSCKVS